ncbi:hypothetical protein [Nocardia sp. NPDC051570]|uniref:terpene synthase family protein n=1 Tax=Nocardia sp. NPDC051570 TaxID=3364324 RepID=UPI00378CDC3B
MNHHGLVDDPQRNADEYRRWKLGEVAAWFWPDATAEGLTIGADLMGWYFAPFDDLFDGQMGRDPLLAGRFTQDLISVLDLDGVDPGPSTHPVIAAFADLWQRSCRGMSDQWRQRAGQNWRGYFQAQLGEVFDRRHRRILDAPTCLLRRGVSTSTGPIIDLIEPISGYEVPDLIWYAPVLVDLRRIVADYFGMINDLVSADKERGHGDANLLLILEEQEQYSRDEALGEMHRISDERFARFARLEQLVPDLDDALTPRERHAVRRHVQGLKDLIVGNNEYEHQSGRYR